MTTPAFLTLWGLASLRDLPDLARLEDAGLLGKAPLPEELRGALGLRDEDEDGASRSKGRLRLSRMEQPGADFTGGSCAVPDHWVSTWQRMPIRLSTSMSEIGCGCAGGSGMSHRSDATQRRA